MVVVIVVVGMGVVRVRMRVRVLQGIWRVSVVSLQRW